MGFLIFSMHTQILRKFREVSVPYGVSYFLYENSKAVKEEETVSVPYGVSYFLYCIWRDNWYEQRIVSVPYGVSYFLYLKDNAIKPVVLGFRPLWGFLFSLCVKKCELIHTLSQFPSPMGFLIFSIRMEKYHEKFKFGVSVPYGVSYFLYKFKTFTLL